MVQTEAIEAEYRPSEDEMFMNERHREYFRRKLLAWREDLLRESRETLAALQNENENHPDFADRASSETDRAIELRARDRQRKLISKIDAALGRIEDGSYGYCEETGEPIALKRLDARPIATLSVEAQERHERRERIYRDDCPAPGGSGLDQDVRRGDFQRPLQPGRREGHGGAAVERARHHPLHHLVAEALPRGRLDGAADWASAEFVEAIRRMAGPAPVHSLGKPDRGSNA